MVLPLQPIQVFGHGKVLVDCNAKADQSVHLGDPSAVEVEGEQVPVDVSPCYKHPLTLLSLD